MMDEERLIQLIAKRIDLVNQKDGEEIVEVKEWDGTLFLKTNDGSLWELGINYVGEVGNV